MKDINASIGRKLRVVMRDAPQDAQVFITTENRSNNNTTNSIYIRIFGW
jgi:hypothetical protein